MKQRSTRAKKDVLSRKEELEVYLVISVAVSIFLAAILYLVYDSKKDLEYNLTIINKCLEAKKYSDKIGVSTGYKYPKCTIIKGYSTIELDESEITDIIRAGKTLEAIGSNHEA